MKKYSDIVIVGSGIAGLTLAIKLAKLKPELKISVLAKGDFEQSNSNYAQGGIASVMNLQFDSYENHFEDTMKSGNGLSDAFIVDMVVKSAPKRIFDLIDYGVQFNCDAKNQLDLALEGGHSVPRIVHTYDKTGEEVMHTLISVARKTDNITFFENRFCSEISKSITGNVNGVVALNLSSEQLEYFNAKIVVLATGGSGQVYQHTTNPSLSTGDGVALGIRVGAMVHNLNYIQFHPTALYAKNQAQLSLITEAIRGFGAHITNKIGQRFIFDYDPRGELATRDIVSSAIYKEMKKTNEPCVYLDCKHLNLNDFKEKFPTVFKKLSDKGIDISNQLIPIVPAAHYQCGGLKVNERGQTNIANLYAIGECAETGLHGANRLASNSLLEALVFAHEAAAFISFTIEEISVENGLENDSVSVNHSNDEMYKLITNRIKKTMSNYATIVAELDGLEKAEIELQEIENEFFDTNIGASISEKRLIFENILTNAKAIVQSKIQSLKPKKNCLEMRQNHPIKANVV
ncbi:MAG: L-aspartate oxidase [Crocinitomicaceae bacterium]